MRNFKAILLIFFLNLVFYFPIFFGRTPLPADNLWAYYPWRFYKEGYLTKGPAYFDVMMITYPWKKLAVQELKSGRFPLWNQYFALGYPYFAAMQGGILYPTTLLFLIFNFNFAWTIHIFLQTFLAGVFMFLLLRKWKLSELASLFGAIVFSFCGYFMVWLEYGTLVNAACWLPLTILLTDLLFEKKNILIAISLSGVLAISFMAGFPQTSFYISVFSIVYFIYKFLKVKGDRRLGILGILGLLGFLGLIAVQLLPFLEYLSLSTRNLADPKTYFSWAMLPTNLIGFLFPDFFGHPSKNIFWGKGNYQEFTVYLGIIPFIFALWAIFRRKAPKFWLLALVGVCFFLIYNPFLYLFYRFNLPFLSKMAPSRLIVLLSFILAVISSYGFESFLKIIKQFFNDINKIYSGILISVLAEIIFFKLVFIQERFHYDFSKIFPEILTSFIWPGIILLLFWLIILILKEKKISVNLGKWILFLIIVIDLYIFGWSYNPFIKTDKVFFPTKTVEFLQSDKNEFRFYSENNVFPGNLSSLFNLNALNAVDTLAPKNFSLLPQQEQQEGQFLDLANVKYFLSGKKLQVDNTKNVFSEEGVNIYERLNCKPKYFFLPENGEEIQKAEFVSISPKTIELSVDAQEKGDLILSQLNYPGWKAEVNGVGKEILPYYKGVFSRIPLEKGENSVKIIFLPKSFQVGATITLLSLGSIIIVAIIAVILKIL